MSNMDSNTQTAKRVNVVRWVGGVAIALSACLLLVVICAAGFFFYTDHYYGLAIASIDKKDFEDGIADLTKVVSIYKSAPKLMQYAQAGVALQDHNYYGARLLYKGLEDFKDSESMVNEVDYQQALSYLAHNDYDKAKELFLTLGNYRDSDQQVSESDYLHAKYLLSQGNFADAKDIFMFLDDYKDSAQMTTECDYQQAASWLSQSLYDRALAAFGELAQNNYKDSKTQLTETKYRMAKQSLDGKDYSAAYNAFLEIKDYKDSAAILTGIIDQIYHRAISSYQAKSYSDAYDDFKTVASYQRSADYLTLIEAHEKDLNSLYDDLAGMRALYAKLKALGSFEDAQGLRTSDAFIHLRLEGKWKDSKGFEFAMTYQKDGWYVDYNLPCYTGKYYKIENSIAYFGDDQSGWQMQFKFQFTAENTMTVYDCKNNATYTMSR